MSGIVHPPAQRHPAGRGSRTPNHGPVEDDMAYMLQHFWPGGTEDQYQATVAVVHPGDGLPDGQTYHAAGPTDGGYLITAVWNSRESSDRFVQDTLMAKMPIAGGFEGKPEERAAEIAHLQTS
jgi:hypothetical protein